MEHKIILLVSKIVNNLTDDLLKKEFLIHPRINNLVGHCYVATETLYHSLDPENQILYRPNTLKVNGVTHWFLKNNENNEIIDITRNQFPFVLDYSKSKNSAFLTKHASKRSQILLKRINENN